VLNQDRAEGGVRLEPISAQAARKLGLIFSSIDPWKKVDWPAERLETFLAGKVPGASRYLIRHCDELVGAVAVSSPWLHGAYLNFLGIVPGKQNTGIGTVVMDCFETEASSTYRNLWVCVSAFNHRAARFYDARGYTRTAILESLIVEGEDEILLRKRL
jgi:ribosomal protein S18 acetylase RimI-like enzyme